MARNPRAPPAEITGVYGALIKRLTRKRFGDVPDGIGVMWHNRRVLKTSMATGQKTARWKECDESLKHFDHMAVASQVGCSFCLDLAYFHAQYKGLDVAKARELPRWRESDLFSPLERDVLEYAEAMTQTSPTVTDDLSARLLKKLGAPGMVELTAFIGLANQMARTNVALGIEAQGFSSACGLAPLAKPSPFTSQA